MINWIAGNWPDRFKCLVNHDGIFDQRSMYYSTEELWFPEWDHGGTYYDNPQGHEKFNPANLVTKWKTPMLVIHGEQDFRVPLEQGIATFTALQRRGIESRLLMFPDENHWVLKPANSLQWHQDGVRLAGCSPEEEVRLGKRNALRARAALLATRSASSSLRACAGCRDRSRRLRHVRVTPGAARRPSRLPS